MELIAIIVAVLVLLLYRMFSDKDHRLFIRDADSETKMNYAFTNVLVLALALVSIYFLIRLIKWLWMQW